MISRQASAFVLVALGGMAGASTRFAVGAVSGEALGATLAVNGIGSFFLGVLLFSLGRNERIGKRIRYLLGTGFFASFTTYSTFIADIALSDPHVAGVYFIGSYAVGFAGIIASRFVVIRLPLGGSDS